jgi:hypothetical protein
MFCYSCGMDSRNNSVCEWCKKPLQGGGGLAPTAQPLDQTQPVSAPVASQVRVSLTGEVYEAPPQAPPAAPPGAYAPPQYAPPQYAPPPGPMRPGAVADRPPSIMSPTAVARTLPPGAVSAQVMDAYERYGQATLGEKWEKCLAIVLPLLLASAWLIHKVPTTYLWVALADLFLVGLAMGATGAIGSYDDAFLDCSVVLIVCFFFGPIIGLTVYLIVGAIKQECNAALVFLILGLIVTQFVTRIAAATVENAFSSLLFVGLMNFIGFFALCATFGGWMLSSFFRPLNE